MSASRTDARADPCDQGHQVLTAAEYRQLGEVISERTGILLPPSKQAEFERRLATELAAVPAGDSLARRVVAGEAQLDQVVEQLTVGETYFFRNRPHIEALKQRILPDLIAGASARGQRRLRIWCAGCATGEEPFSIAILLQEHFPLLATWSIELYGTDINGRFLEQAREGRYSEWSFRNTSQDLRLRHFSGPVDERWTIHPALRKAVTFHRLNLANPPYREAFPEDLDLILCRNVLIYFERTRANQVIHNLTDVLRPGGYLLTGHAESFPALGELNALYGHASFYYQRGAPDALPVPAQAGQDRCVEPIVPRRKSPTPLQVDKPARLASITSTRGAPAEPPHQGRDPVDDSQHPAPVDAVLDAARACADTGDLQDALDLLGQLPDQSWLLDHRVHFLKAMVLDQASRPAEAIQSLRQALFLRRDFAVAHYYQGIIAEREGDLPCARRCFANVTALLEHLADSQILEEAGGLTAGRLLEISVERLLEVTVNLESGEMHGHFSSDR